MGFLPVPANFKPRPPQHFFLGLSGLVRRLQTVARLRFLFSLTKIKLIGNFAIFIFNTLKRPLITHRLRDNLESESSPLDESGRREAGAFE